MPTGYEPEIEHLRAIYQQDGTLVLMGRDKPDPAWAARWHVDLCSVDPVDVRHIVEILRQWLPATGDSHDQYVSRQLDA